MSISELCGAILWPLLVCSTRSQWLRSGDTVLVAGFGALHVESARVGPHWALARGERLSAPQGDVEAEQESRDLDEEVDETHNSREQEGSQPW